MVVQHSQNEPNSSANFVKADEFRQYIEKEVLLLIQQLAKGETTTKERIQNIAREALVKLKPHMSVDELYRSAIQLDDTYPEMGPVVIKLMQEYEEKYNGQAVQEVSTLIKAGQYDEAEQLVKKVLMFKGV